MTLSTNQIAEIKKFIHSRGFTRIEIEMEILDHVASSIEEKMEAKPQMSFEKALKEVHGNFGVMGFSVMEDEFGKSFGNIMNGQLKASVRSYLMGPKVLYSLLIYSIFILLGFFLIPFLSHSATSFKIYYYLLAILVTIIGLMANNRRDKKWSKKSYVLSRIAPYTVFTFTIFGQLFGLVSEYIIKSSGETVSITIFALLSSILVLYGVIVFELSKWAFQWTNERYLKYA